MLESVPASHGPILLDKIKPADRVTFMLNSMFLAIRNNQLLQSDDMRLLQRLFLVCMEQYAMILADWITRGELNDRCQELFIKANDKPGQGKSAKQQWIESFIYRTVNLRDLMQ